MATCTRTDRGAWEDEYWDPSPPGEYDTADLNGYYVTLNSYVTVASVTSSAGGGYVTIGSGGSLTTSTVVGSQDNLIEVNGGSLYVTSSATQNSTSYTDFLIHVVSGYCDVKDPSGKVLYITESGGGSATVRGTIYQGTASNYVIWARGTGTISFDVTSIWGDLGWTPIWIDGATAVGSIVGGDRAILYMSVGRLGESSSNPLLVYASAESSQGSIPIVVSDGIVEALRIIGEIGDYVNRSLLEISATGSHHVELTVTSGDLNYTGIIALWAGSLEVTGDVTIGNTSSIVYMGPGASSVTLKCKITMDICALPIYDESTAGTLYYVAPNMIEAMTIKSDGSDQKLELPDYPSADSIKKGVTARFSTITGTYQGGGGGGGHMSHLYG